MGSEAAAGVGASLVAGAWLCFTAHVRARRRRNRLVEAAREGIKTSDALDDGDVGELRIVQGMGHARLSEHNVHELVGKLSGRPCLAFVVEKVRLVDSEKGQTKSKQAPPVIHHCPACGHESVNKFASTDKSSSSSKSVVTKEHLVERDGDQLDRVELAESRSSPPLGLDLQGISLTDGRSFVKLQDSTEVYSEPASGSNPRTAGFCSREKILPLNSELWAFGVVRHDQRAGGYVVRPIDDGVTVFMGNRSYAQSIDFLSFTTTSWLVASVCLASAGAALLTATLTGGLPNYL
ncbi:Hypothetical Protein FCC1311_050492 [Hondaea fermentalgiana]|uniref:Uncharacterized protein n=1 Tax=Hondaea fermentalgiana TaxID=2315210 RepID=A0A2R5GGE5_9STRA|nr:Hypothetical Protein FCC1311_050492 [Hondaea fermentalgiana]|eukprot:GBG28828.1 Hypothetical Protein FCC1311_050492 [Hondaea fermentalgiana]